MKVLFADIECAFDFVCYGMRGGNSAILDKETGKIYYDSALGDFDEIPDGVMASEHTIELPHKNDLDLGSRLVFRFVGKFMPDDYDTVQKIFSRRSAYAYYKDLLEEKEMLDAWHTYENAATQAAIRKWCAENGIELM